MEGELKYVPSFQVPLYIPHDSVWLHLYDSDLECGGGAACASGVEGEAGLIVVEIKVVLVMMRADSNVSLIHAITLGFWVSRW